MTFIYVLKLKDSKYYVGRTNNPDFRLAQHFKFGGSAWTKKHTPIRVVELISGDKYDEDKYTIVYMAKYGVENVRGGSFCEVELDTSDIAIIERMMRNAQDRCFNCGGEDHFVNECPIEIREQFKNKISYQKLSYQNRDKLIEMDIWKNEDIDESDIHTHSGLKSDNSCWSHCGTDRQIHEILSVIKRLFSANQAN